MDTSSESQEACCPNDDDGVIALRSYQVALVETSSRQNSIIFLPTGSGKTCIAIFTLKSYGETFEGTIAEGGKRCLFVAPTRALVYQQARTLKQQTAFRVAAYTSDNGGNFWTDTKWLNEFDKYQVLVMTPAIMELVLAHTPITLAVFSIIIFDECHNGVGNQSYRGIMRELKNIPKYLQPRILGLTATLLNCTVPLGKIHQELSNLEKTFQSKIVSCDILTEVLKYSANPTIKMYAYEDCEQINNLEAIQEQCLIAAERWTNIAKQLSTDTAPAGYQNVRKSSNYNLVNRAIMDINENSKQYGIFMASITVLYFIIEFEQKRLIAADEINQCLFAEVVSCLHQMRSTLMKIMEDDDTVTSIKRFSSPKLLMLMDFLKQHESDCPSIIFVQRRTTAVALAHVLSQLSHDDADYNRLSVGFLIGGRGNPLVLQRLNLFEQCRMERTLKAFATGKCNTIVATSVMEEGVDIPACSRVYQMDSDKIHYRSFVQSKGRCRNKIGQFIMLMSKSDEAKVRTTVNNCVTTERELYKLLVGGNKDRQGPSEDSINESLYEQAIEPFYVSGPNSAHVTGITAVSCVARYCSSLPQDKFSDLKPLLFVKKRDEKSLFGLKLPINSPIRDMIEGKPMDTLKLAKKSVMVETVRVLYESGELSDSLIPKQKSADQADFSWIFKHYKEETAVNNQSSCGSKKRRQLYDLKHAEAVNGCLPTPMIPCYLHIITFNPIYEEPAENINKVIYQMLKSVATYAILSTKPLQKICEFPLYLSAGEVRCKVLTNPKMVQFCANDLNLIAKFHLEIFSQVGSFPDFLILSKGNEDNSFYVVPVNSTDNVEFQIDWGVINNVQSFFYPVKNDSFDLLNQTHLYSIISPDYRGTTDFYVVSKVMEDLTPLSPFPDAEMTTFASYFKNKYKVEVTNKSQHLLEVKKLPSVDSCYIRPRKSVTPEGIRTKRKNPAGDDTYKEILIPELCTRYLYPSALWLKLNLLPTALYRIDVLLLVEELHRRIRTEAAIGSPMETWAPLQPQLVNSKQTYCVNTSSSKKSLMPVPAGTPCKKVNEPMDLLSNMGKVADCDIKYFVDHLNLTKTNVSEHQALSFDGNYFSESTIISPPVTAGLALKILNPANQVGPELCDLLAAVTAKSANDIVNLERMETLGDSFLKLASSLFLFLEHPKMNEGNLTQLKGKITSNRNLLYCGQAMNIPAVLQSQEFTHKGEWLPPLVEIPTELRQRFQVDKINPSILYTMPISYQERLKGAIEPSTLTRLSAVLDAADAISDEQTAMARSVVQFKKKVLNDKGVADCVEAIIGAYLQSQGLEGGLKVMKWLGILPASGLYTNAENLFKIPAPSPSKDLANVLSHLARNQTKDLEKMLKYEFHDKSYLLQALTHASYSSHQCTDCYQRLEFLGDAVLDFLITCFIYQQAPHLGPGDITILRSALVNNTTFACQVVKFGIHRYIYSFSGPLADAIARFASEQENRGHVVDEAVSVLHEEKDTDNCITSISEALDVPKALGDLMESLAGAIFLDSGNSLETVWTVFYPLFKTELDAFSANMPKNSISFLSELDVAQFKNLDEKTPGVSSVCVELSLPSGKVDLFYGFGDSKYNAKLSAAKSALRRYHAVKQSSSCK